MRKHIGFTVTALTVAACAVALLSGCTNPSASAGRIDLTPPSPPTRHAPANPHRRRARAHLTRLGCIYLRARLGLPLLGSPPPPPPGVAAAQPTPKPSMQRARIEAYLIAHTNCAQTPRRQAAARPQHPPTYRPPPLTTDSPPVSAYYPPAAQRLGVEGQAVMRVCIDAQGRVTSASIIRSSGSPLLDRAALRYARATSGHWVPATRAGCTTLPARFSQLGGF